MISFATSTVQPHQLACPTDDAHHLSKKHSSHQFLKGEKFDCLSLEDLASCTAVPSIDSSHQDMKTTAQPIFRAASRQHVPGTLLDTSGTLLDTSEDSTGDANIARYPMQQQQQQQPGMAAFAPNLYAGIGDATEKAIPQLQCAQMQPFALDTLTLLDTKQQQQESWSTISSSTNTSSHFLDSPLQCPLELSGATNTFSQMPSNSPELQISPASAFGPPSITSLPGNIQVSLSEHGQTSMPSSMESTHISQAACIPLASASAGWQSSAVNSQLPLQPLDTMHSPSLSSASSSMSSSVRSPKTDSTFGPFEADATRRRAPGACNFCRVRKLRCDGISPCRQCSRRNITCVVSEAGEHRRKRRAENVAAGRGSSASRRSRTADFQHHQFGLFTAPATGSDTPTDFASLAATLAASSAAMSMSQPAPAQFHAMRMDMTSFAQHSHPNLVTHPCGPLHFFGQVQDQQQHQELIRNPNI